MSSIDHRLIHTLFEHWAAQSPEAKAVVCNGQCLSYGELDARADQLAHKLRQAGVQRETPVGLCVDRSLEMIIGMLGILKAHGAYVPLSPTLPAERLAYMLADSGASIVLAPERLHGSLPFAAARLLGFECTSAAPAARARPSGERIDSSSLAYIIYTSGSTGRPKGVQVEHGSVANLLITVPPLLNAVAGDVWTVYHSYAFDFSVWEIWAPLTSGATLVIVPDDVAQSPNAFAELLRREQVTVLNQTPSALVQLMASMDTGALNHLPVRVLICGGDAFPVGQLPQLRAWNVDLWNFYGPTEATVWSTIHRLDLSSATATTLVPLGKPIPNTRVHVLDGQLQPVAAGTQGELCIGGACVARGYRNRPDLTAERFTTFEGERLYRTGDLACVEHDAAIRFLGRADHQVKIRGFRIELGEIEAQLVCHPDVREAVVCVCEGPSQAKQLAAFFVANPQPDIDVLPSLRAHLRSRLPEYMVPASFVRLETLPLTNNGKVDRSMLSALASAHIRAHVESAPPQTRTQQLMLEIWEKALKVRPIGVNDNFFDLGGDSLSAMGVATQIERKFGCEIAPELFFQCPTIAQLATAVEALGPGARWLGRRGRIARTASALCAASIRGVEQATRAFSSGRQRLGDEIQEVRDLMQCLGAKSALVPIQRGGAERPPLFCVPGVVGSVIYLYDLARSMGADQPFYGLQARGLDGQSEPYTRVEDMARYCVEAIKSVQKTGPYFLAGHSNGSHVALEIALQLEAAGDDVGLVVVLDEVAPIAESYYAPGYWDDARLLTYLARLIQDWTGTELGIDYERMARLNGKAQWSLLMQWMRKVNVALPMIGKTQIRGMLRTLKASLLAEYVPAVKLGGQVAVFRTSKTHHDETTTEKYIQLRDDPALCWEPMSERAVLVVPMPGDHVSFLNRPLVAQVGQALRTAIDDAERRSEQHSHVPFLSTGPFAQRAAAPLELDQCA